MVYLNCLKGCTSFSEAEHILKKKNLNIKVYDDPPLYIVTYNKKTCNMSDPDVKKCRGIVLSKKDNRLVCPVPPKSEQNIEFRNQSFIL